MIKPIQFGEVSESIPDKESVSIIYWSYWLIFKPNQHKEWQTELKKSLPPYFDVNVNKINDFSMRENVLFPPCPQEFLEGLMNGIILRNELGLYRSKFYYLNELEGLLNEFLRLFYYRIDTIVDIFQTGTKLSLSKEKFPKVVIKCSNCKFFVFITVHCLSCENEFYCDETCRKFHSKAHSEECISATFRLPKIIEPLRIEVHIDSKKFGEEVYIYNEHSMKFSKMMKGRVLLSFLYRSFRKDRWFRNNKYTIQENVEDHHITIKRGVNVDIEIMDYELKEFLYKMDIKQAGYYADDEYRDMLKLSILQELKLNFFKLGGLLIDILKEQHPSSFKYILIFHFP